MTVGVIDVLWRITPKSSSDFLDRVGDKQVVLQRMYLGCKGECQKTAQKFVKVGATSTLLYS
jgi:hypothetical protein